MKLNLKLFAVAAAAGCLSLNAIGVYAETPENYERNINSNAEVTFKANESITKPVDPVNPGGGEVIPVDPDGNETDKQGTAGPLSIDFASDFYFGEQKISSADEIYYAAPQKIKVDVTEEGEPLIEDRANYVQVTDNRGGAHGWDLSISQSGQFETAGGTELDGAVITLGGAGHASASSSEAPNVNEVAIDLEDTLPVMEAAEGEGAGTHLATFSEVSLSVPGTTVKEAAEYTTTVTWTLSDLPNEDIE